MKMTETTFIVETMRKAADALEAGTLKIRKFEINNHTADLPVRGMFLQKVVTGEFDLKLTVFRPSSDD